MGSLGLAMSRKGRKTLSPEDFRQQAVHGMVHVFKSPDLHPGFKGLGVERHAEQEKGLVGVRG